jgi:hypothetical protein
MRHVVRLFAISFVVPITLAGADTPKPAGNALDDQALLLAPIQVDSLTLTPIVAKDDKSISKDDLLVLDEAMANKQVTIKEVGEGSVNDLTLTNRADRPLFLLAGEVILGGNQDRIIGRNTVIPAKTTQEVPVFCVEHGRWDGKSKEFTTGKSLAHGRLRGKASFEAQQDVWNEVSDKNEKRATKSASDTYRKVAQQQSDGTLGGMEKKVNAALDKIAAADRARMIGYAVSLNGQVVTVDRFGSPTLFKKLETKLVRSYLTEAIDVKAQKDVKAPSPADVKTFMVDADKAAETVSYDTDAASTHVNMGKRAYKAKVEYNQAKASEHSAPAEASPPAPTVYQTYQAH